MDNLKGAKHKVKVRKDLQGFKRLFPRATTFSDIRIESIVISIAPHVDRHKVADVGWNLALHDCSIAAYHVLVVSFNFVILNDSFD